MVDTKTNVNVVPVVDITVREKIFDHFGEKVEMDIGSKKQGPALCSSHMYEDEAVIDDLDDFYSTLQSAKYDTKEIKKKGQTDRYIQ